MKYHLRKWGGTLGGTAPHLREKLRFLNKEHKTAIFHVVLAHFNFWRAINVTTCLFRRVANITHIESFKDNCHLFMYSRKRFPWDRVIKLRDNRIFKALLWIKKSFKSIHFDLAKHASVFNVNNLWNLFEKFQILKLRWAYSQADQAATS